MSDIIVIGAGMAGVSVAYELAKTHDVHLLEAENHLGVHATGRSAAAFIESYGYQNLSLLTLSTQSFDFLQNPSSDFSEEGFLKQRGLLTIADESNQTQLHQEFQALSARFPQTKWLDRPALLDQYPALKDEFTSGAIFEPNVHDIDVHRLQQCYLKGFKSRGGICTTGSAVTAIDKTSEGWSVTTAKGVFTARLVVNAAGAWADEIALLAGTQPVGLVPHRRTAILVESPEQADQWPVFLDFGAGFYFKPDAGLLLVSPGDETPDVPRDAQPEELDIAQAAYHLEQALCTSVTHIRHSWAGLRTFAPDRTPVIGFDAHAPDFFWYAGQGGHGIQTAPAGARMAAGLITGNPARYGSENLDEVSKLCSPVRFGCHSNIERMAVHA